MNFDPGQTAANLAMVMIPDSGQVCFTSFVPTHLIVDVAGWFSPTSQGIGDGYVTVDPVRVLDTRQTRAAGGRPGAPLQPGRSVGVPGRTPPPHS